jgi:hypothetical protein
MYCSWYLVKVHAGVFAQLAVGVRQGDEGKTLVLITKG